MKRLLLALLAAVFATSVGAAETCTAQSQEKKLAGAAQKSFMKKCESDAAARCETAAGDKKLSGAAKTSFVKKCVADAVGG